MVFILIFILLIIPMFLEAFKLLEDNIEKNAYTEMDQGVQLLANEIEAINNVICRLQMDKNYAYVRGMKGSVKSSEHYIMHEISNDLLELTDILFFSVGPRVYFSNGIIISPQMPYMEVYQENESIICSTSFGGQEEWLSTLGQENYSYQFLPVDTFYSLGTGTFDGISYVNTYKGFENYAKGMFITIFPVDTILDITGLKRLIDTANIKIEDTKTGELLYTNHLNIDSPKSEFSIQGNQLYVMVEIPKNYFLNQMQGMFVMAGIYVFLFLVIAVLVSFLLAYRNSRPLHRIITALDKYTDTIEEDRSRGYAYIEKSIDIMADRIRKNQINYKRLNDEMDHWLLREQIIHGLEGDHLKKLQMKLRNYAIPFRLCILHIAHGECEIPSSEVRELLEQSGISINFFSKVRPNLFVMIPVQNRVCVEWKKIFEDIVTQIEAVWQCESSVFVSQSLNSMEHLNEVYHAGRYSMKNLSNLKVVMQEQLESNMENSLSEFNLLENVKLTDLILDGCEHEAKELISGQWYQVSISNVYSTMEQLFYVQTAVLNSISGKLGCNKRIDTLKYSENIHNIEDELLTFVEELCAIARKMKETHKNELAIKIVECINDNFTDHNFYMEILEEKFGVSAKTINRAMKSYINQNFSKYLEQLRIQRARELLKNTDISVDTIAFASGFGSDNTFYKVFKRVCGVSPGAYRANQRYMKDI